MYPTDITYERPASVAEANALLQAEADGQGAGGEIKLLAGGQSLLPLMKLRLAESATLVDIARIPELRGIREAGDALVIGAATPYYTVLDSELARRRCPLLGEVIARVGDMQVRARGTVGGSLAHADPAADLPAAAVALEATFSCDGPAGTREIAARDFFMDLLTTALEPGEILTAIRFPATDQPSTGVAYEKHRHPASGYAVAGVAAVLRVEGERVAEARVGITGASTHATRATALERALVGSAATTEALATAAELAADGLELMSDAYASMEYRAHLTRVLARRALERALIRAQRGG
jgi:carbon-monoxide dehydrogenase medium subunit